MDADGSAAIVGYQDDPLQISLGVFVKIDQRLEVSGAPRNHGQLGDGPVGESAPPCARYTDEFLSNTNRGRPDVLEQIVGPSIAPQ